MKLNDFLNAENGFPMNVKGKKPPIPRTGKYDVQITLNKSGNKAKSVVRIGMHNELSLMKMYKYATYSFTKEKLTLVFTDKKPDRVKMYTVQCDKPHAVYTATNFTFTPVEGSEKTIMAWIGKGFPAHMSTALVDEAMVYVAYFEEGLPLNGN